MTAGRDGRGGEEKLRSEVREAGDALLRLIGNNCQFEGQHSVSLQLLLFFPHQNSKKILCPFENLTQIKCLFSVPACSGCATNKFFFFLFYRDRAEWRSAAILMGLIGALSVRRLKSERSRANECKEERKGLHYTLRLRPLLGAQRMDNRAVLVVVDW